jgi:hypothetical protein
MVRKMWIIIACVLFIALLSACQQEGGDNIVGRWEFEDQNFGMAYEFYEDGTGVMVNSVDPFFPLGGDFSYTYDPETGVLEQTIRMTESMDKTNLATITFVSENEIIMEQSGLIKPSTYTFNRKPLPELPFMARARLGGILVGQSFTFNDAQKLEPGWREGYIGFTQIEYGRAGVKIGEIVEEWLVTLQMEGEEDSSLYVLRKWEGGWDVLQLVKND